MKIIAISALPLWVMGGKKGLPTIYRGLKGFVDAGHEVHFITPSPSLWRSDLDREWRTKPMEEVYDGIHIHRFTIPFHVSLRDTTLAALPGRRIPRYVHRFAAFLALATLWALYTASAFFAGLRIAKAHTPDVVYAHNGIAAAAAYLLARKYRVPNITRLYGTFLSQVAWRTSHLLLQFPEVLGFKIPCAYLIVTNDGTQGDQVADRLGVPPERLKFWINGVDKSIYDPNLTIAEAKERLGIQPDRKAVLSLNRLDGWKRIDRLINATPEIVAQYPNVSILIVGDGNERENLIGLARALGVERVIRFEGAVSREKVRDYMHAADVFVSTQDLTNFGNHLIEAMTCGRCIVTLNNGDTGKFIANEDTGILLEPNQLESLPALIIGLLRDDGLRKRLAGNALAYAHRNFQTWEERMRTETSLVEDLVKRTRTA